MTQKIQLKTPNDFAKTLGVHINHLNKVLKETTTRSTTEIINGRIVEELSEISSIRIIIYKRIIYLYIIFS